MIPNRNQYLNRLKKKASKPNNDMRRSEVEAYRVLDSEWRTVWS